MVAPFLNNATLAGLQAMDEANMPATCAVTRNIAGSGPSGAPAKPNYQPVAPGAPVKCRVTDLRRRPDVQEEIVALQLQGIQVYLLFVPLTTDLKPNDHVTVSGETFQVIGTNKLSSFSTSIEALIKAVGATS